MDKKIVFFDVDGTLYDREMGIPETTKISIRQLRERGHIPVICTGRTRVMVPENLINIGFSGVVAGAGTYIEYQGEVLHHKVQELKLVKELLDLLKQNNITYMIEGPDCIYYDNSIQTERYQEIKTIISKLCDGKVAPITDSKIQLNKITCAIYENSHLDAVMPYIEDKFNVIYHQGDFIEMVPTGYNKATGIEKLIQYLNIDRRNTYAFGDSTNDLEMLEYVEYGIAMGNSYEEVLEKARYKTKDIKEDGIYYGLKEFGLI